ncbi:hypothetical protein GA0116948_103214 [Chitinophaga costaii]|uniref:Uncharacterized protein n=1 Tax=Chitinophaga costaii TaxID=1335309 RepID=A0A1C4BQL4_9BACT|nr:hypothetical protein [Chitinophaga costaii]PUZ27511.1 hypothetical protein DCM91_04590 [Chitinophaga costaii]SCC09221.1 hypothetical protein GA0116948_103214 [Chitinophaga costaii]
MQQDQTGPDRRQRSVNYRALGQIVRGLLFVFVGLFILYGERMGITLRAAPTVKYIFGVLAIIYGVFRLSQGVWNVIKK